MLSLRRGAAHPLRSRIIVRGFAAYSPKVRAFPFKVSPSEAIAQLSIAGVQVSSTRSDAPQPRKIVPVYFPAWFIDAEIEAKVTLLSVKDDMTVYFHNSYLPGYTGLDKLAGVSLLSDSLALAEAVPFTEELATQRDTKVTCLPFKTTPFLALDATNSLSSDQCRINEVLSLDSSSITAKLICAYPVLIPLYLAQSTDNKTVVLEAHHEEGRILEERGPNDNVFEKDDRRAQMHQMLRSLGLPPPSPNDGVALRLLRFFEKAVLETENSIDKMEAMAEGLFAYLRGAPTPFVNIAGVTIASTFRNWNYIHVRDFQHWVDKFRTTGTIPTSPNDTDIMLDPRVRPFIQDEVTAVRKFMKISHEIFMAHLILESVAKGDRPYTSREREFAEKNAGSLDVSREKAIPSWWKEWQENSTKKPS
ncbi:hypothetical protein MSAN_00376100 [Mycena sanguinolenta]|uniref:Uncharacterized protein n=1 Tax=Mycena sanguinolenta TaxID=230812 RepID=A0A8H6ZFX0_9AGAR|nr:hypothetical protein MSAN_00376100 [Mycena sanguinolenta]